VIRPTPIHLLVFAVSFAMVGICTALALQSGANPLTVVTIRTLGTAALMLGFFLLTKVVLSMTRRDRLIAIALGIPLSINNFLINSAIAEIPVPLVVLIFYLWPALTGVASWLLRKEPFRWRALAGLLAWRRSPGARRTRIGQAKGVSPRVPRSTGDRVHGDQPFLPRPRHAADATMILTYGDLRDGVPRTKRAAADDHARLSAAPAPRHSTPRDDRYLRRHRTHRALANRLLHELRADRGGAARGADPRPDPRPHPARRRRAGRRCPSSLPPARHCPLNKVRIDALVVALVITVPPAFAFRPQR
jgi:hypothetical protein